MDYVLAFALLMTSAASIIYYLGRCGGEKSTLPLGPQTPAQWTALDSVIVLLFYLVTNYVAKYAGEWLAAIGRLGSYQPRIVVTIALTYLFNCLALGLVYLYARLGGRPAAALGLSTGLRARSTAFGVMFFLLFIPFEYIYPALVNDAWFEAFRMSPEQQFVVRSFSHAGLALTVTLALAATIAAPIVEETIFRAFVQRGVENTFGTPVAVIVTAILFSAVHVSASAARSSSMALLMSLPTAVAIFPLALLLSLLYARTRNLLINIVLHAVFNGFTVLILLATR